MASHDIEKDIGEPNDQASSKEGERPEIANIEDVERQKEQVESRLSRFTTEEEEAVIRKLDWHLMPLIFVLYSLSVLDRSNLGNAKIAGMSKDIDIAGNRYAWLGTIFYISYILFQWTQMGWKVFPPHRWVAFAVLFWGTVSSVQAACTSWEGLMVCRFLLAIPEAMYGPAVPLYLSYFYPRERLGLRVGIFLSGSALANAYGGALAYGISQAHGAIHPWRILFLVEGLPTIALAVVAYFWLPDSPSKARFLSERDREIAIELSLRQPGDRNSDKFQWKQAVGALLDYRSYIPPLIYFGCNVCFASLPLFVPTIISEMGAFTAIQSNGLSAPPYVLCFISIVTCAFISDRVGVRGPFVAGAGLVAAIGYILLATQKTVAVRYFGFFLATIIFTSVALVLSWVSNTHATDSKRAAGLAILATGGQCGPVLGTNIFPPNDAPFYRKGMWISCGACLLVFFLASLQSFLLWKENQRRDKKYGKQRDTTYIPVQDELGNDKYFRYVI
ncbi:MFS general substrate transporter [Hyaloscypha variabilis]|jgi:MFS family permease|uniref:MFS general substrate transporter n=1 Tax=Hyaloscypha variabilis (strain UAMH 11265 / GT02V1 / F) TaxID=1149755 RepID=A0A2J6QSE6_HYAVF|nr:MFS general substrate transporter [Hyaloscypha variabilis F]